ncbi:MAG: hemolysin III family protein [Gammaproteobacteria bacterium]
MTHTSDDYSAGEEFAHALSHGVGALLSALGLVWMLAVSISVADPWRIVASSVYGASMITLFLASTLYHSARGETRRRKLKLFDHCAIYLLIAGTYTPFMLVAMRTQTGWWLFGAVWTLALVGVLSKLFFGHRFPKLSLFSYLLMGWLVILAGPQIAAAIGGGGMKWLVAGGVCYTIGAVFYAVKRIAFNHVIWHLFVLAGGACHFLAVVWYVLPAPAVA